jgi:hypothetical protein
MKYRLSRLASATAAALVICAPAFAGGAIDYPDFVDPANYPAHVSAIHFQNCTIDAQHSCSWGAWSVTFGPGAPVASFLSGGGIDQVQVSGLLCTNSVSGSKACGSSYSKQVCTQGLTSGLAPIFVECPTSIELAFQ